MSQHSNLVKPGSACAVRPPRPSDFNEMADLALQLGYECTSEEIKERVSHMQDPNCYAVFVAELPGGHIAGWIGAYLFRSVETGSCAEINGLIVEQSIRSCGIG